MADGAYAMIQGTKPKVVSLGLNDSPVALATWLLQLYFDFGNKEKSIEERFNKQDLFTNISIYWFTQTIYSSMRVYSEDMSGYEDSSMNKLKTATGFSLHSYDINGIPPKEFANRFFDKIVQWNEHREGGHFSAYNHSETLKNDIINFVELLNNAAGKHRVLSKRGRTLYQPACWQPG